MTLNRLRVIGFAPDPACKVPGIIWTAAEPLFISRALAGPHTSSGILERVSFCRLASMRLLRLTCTAANAAPNRMARANTSQACPRLVSRSQRPGEGIFCFKACAMDQAPPKGRGMVHRLIRGVTAFISRTANIRPSG